MFNIHDSIIKIIPASGFDPANAIINPVLDIAMRADTANWLGSAEYDLETAQHMLAAGRYLYVVFMCHLALEKMLKTHVAELRKETPARTHDLLYRVRNADLELTKDHLEFIGRINNASIPTRYPDDIERVLREYSEPVAHEYFEKKTEVIDWLKGHPNLQT